MDGWIDQLNSFAHGTVSHDVVVVLGCKIQSPEQLCVVDILPVGISKRGSNFCWSLRCYLRWMLFGSILAGCQIPGSEGLFEIRVLILMNADDTISWNTPAGNGRQGNIYVLLWSSAIASALVALALGTHSSSTFQIPTVLSSLLSWHRNTHDSDFGLIRTSGISTEASAKHIPLNSINEPPKAFTALKEYSRLNFLPPTSLVEAAPSNRESQRRRRDMTGGVM